MAEALCLFSSAWNCGNDWPVPCTKQALFTTTEGTQKQYFFSVRGKSPSFPRGRLKNLPPGKGCSPNTEKYCLLLEIIRSPKERFFKELSVSLMKPWQAMCSKQRRGKSFHMYLSRLAFRAREYWQIKHRVQSGPSEGQGLDSFTVLSCRLQAAYCALN